MMPPLPLMKAAIKKKKTTKAAPATTKRFFIAGFNGPPGDTGGGVPKLGNSDEEFMRLS
jgi:hypothetical protein